MYNINKTISLSLHCCVLFQGDCCWCNVSGRKVVLKPSSLSQLTEAERHALQKIVLSKLQAMDLGCSISIPKGNLYYIQSKTPTLCNCILVFFFFQICCFQFLFHGTPCFWTESIYGSLLGYDVVPICLHFCLHHNSRLLMILLGSTGDPDDLVILVIMLILVT